MLKVKVISEILASDLAIQVEKFINRDDVEFVNMSVSQGKHMIAATHVAYIVYKEKE